ncbi:hypothetical protein [Chitinimonas sp.]|uniref:hypothetical protein n=1 Tax=Chitinimonas sp. TaxID=1934313 RepID=UPI0035B3FFD0
MSRIATSLAVITWSAIVFASGYVFREHQMLHSHRVETTQPLVLVSSTGNAEGILPLGTTLYGYRSAGEQSLFIAFIGTKELSKVRAQGSKNWLEISPITAFGKKP